MKIMPEKSCRIAKEVISATDVKSFQIQMSDNHFNIFPQ